MDDDLGLPCVLVRCLASGNNLYVWMESEWDKNETYYLDTGRTLITRAPNKTCHALRELMTQQEKENAN